MQTKNVLRATAAIAVAGSFLSALPAFAETAQGNANANAKFVPGVPGMMRGKPGGAPGMMQGKYEGLKKGSTTPNMMRAKFGDIKNENKKNKASSTSRTMPPVITGNGQPIVGGKVTAVSGNSLTITNASNVTYTVDATNAKVIAGKTLATIASVKVGDQVVAQGTVNGTAVVASSIMDAQLPPASPAGKPTTPKLESKGFFGGIGSFFSHLFGF